MPMTSNESTTLLNTLDEAIIRTIDLVTSPYDARDDVSEEEMFAAVLSVLSRVAASAALAAGYDADSFAQRMHGAFRIYESHKRAADVLNKAASVKPQ